MSALLFWEGTRQKLVRCKDLVKTEEDLGRFVEGLINVP